MNSLEENNVDKNYYQLLNLNRNASVAEVKRAYFKQAHLYHPDINKEKDAEKKFIEIKKAYETLSDEEKRKEYDYYLDYQKLSENFIIFDEKEEIYAKRFGFDLTYFSDLLKRDFNKSEFDKYINSLSVDQVMTIYSFFWKTFWSTNSIMQTMIKNNSLTYFYQSFLNYFLTIDLLKEYKRITKKSREIDKRLDYYKSSFLAINKGIEILNNNNAYEYIMDVITKSKIFDDSDFVFFSIELKNELLYIMNKLIDLSSNINNKNPTTIKKIKKNKKRVDKSKKFFISIIAFITIIFIVFIVFVVLKLFDIIE
ncbi:DnaJ domain-containing protein [Mesomycoplasma moatsii]|uniref:DnaJ domain-containing protein n=1 Tax=Mesomycoplasma moatsii TaxID=171287 RepID=UPI0003B6D117